jgi:hypothetical protein
MEGLAISPNGSTLFGIKHEVDRIDWCHKTWPLIVSKDRSTSFDPSLQKQLRPNDDGFSAHTIVLNGQVIGGWRRTIKKMK